MTSGFDQLYVSVVDLMVEYFLCTNCDWSVGSNSMHQELTADLFLLSLEVHPYDKPPSRSYSMVEVHHAEK